MSGFLNRVDFFIFKLKNHLQIIVHWQLFPFWSQTQGPTVQPIGGIGGIPQAIFAFALVADMVIPKARLAKSTNTNNVIFFMVLLLL